MSGFSVDVDELNSLAFDLGEAGVRATVGAAAVVQKTAQDVVATAQQLVPVDTSATKNSIGADPADSGLTAVIGPTTEYAHFLEYGTVNMPPYAFMGPALDRHTPDFVSAMEQLAGGLL